jgi:hypothetical protein
MGKICIDEKLLEQLITITGRRLDTIEQMEEAFEDLKAAIGQQALDKRLGDLPAEDDKPKPCPRCQRPVPVHNKDVARTFESMAGSHKLERNYHYCRQCKRGFYPRDAELGLPAQGSVTSKLEKRLLDFAVNDPYEHSAERWEVHYPHRPFSENMFRLTTERVGQRLEAATEPLLQKELAPPTTGRRKLLYVLNDGSMLPKVGGSWKEAKVGVLVDGENYIAGRAGKRGQVMQARYVSVWGEQSEFKELMRHALDAQRWQRYEQVVWLGDGLPSNWILADTTCPTAVQILDPGHAIENAMKCGRMLLGEGHSLLEDWQKRIEQLLNAGDMDVMVRELMECLAETSTDKQLEALDDLVRYYRNNQERMAYPFYRSQGWIVGSGMVESAHRHVLEVRMKRAGQHWSERHGRQMVRLRSAYRTAGPKRFHDAINRAVLYTYMSAQRRAEQARLAA